MIYILTMEIPIWLCSSLFIWQWQYHIIIIFVPYLYKPSSHNTLNHSLRVFLRWFSTPISLHKANEMMNMIHSSSRCFSTPILEHIQLFITHQIETDCAVDTACMDHCYCGGYSMFGPLLHSSDNTNSALPINCIMNHLMMGKWMTFGYAIYIVCVFVFRSDGSLLVPGSPVYRLNGILMTPNRINITVAIPHLYHLSSHKAYNHTAVHHIIHPILSILLTWSCTLAVTSDMRSHTKRRPPSAPLAPNHRSFPTVDRIARSYNPTNISIIILSSLHVYLAANLLLLILQILLSLLASVPINTVRFLIIFDEGILVLNPTLATMLCDRPNSIDYELNLNDPIPRYCNPHSILHLNVILYFCFYRLTCTLISIYILSSHSLGHILAHLKKKYRKSTRLNSSHCVTSRMPSYA
eukprot:117650_1